MNEAVKSALMKKIAAVNKQSSTSKPYREAVVRLIQEVVPFDAYCFTTIDPRTLLSTGAVAESGVEKMHHSLFINEYQTEDFNKYAKMIHDNDVALVLSTVTEGRLHLSSRYKNILQPSGYEDELRAVLMVDGTCWGYLTLFRHTGCSWFTKEDCTLIKEIVPEMARALRNYYLNVPSSAPEGIDTDPGILVLSSELEVKWNNPSAERWIRRLREAGELGEGVLPHPIRAVSTSIQQANGESEVSSSKFRTCVSLPGGVYLSIQASLLTNETDEQQIAVWFEHAPLQDLLPVMIQSYGLTSRETEVLELVLQGKSTKDAADSLYISVYTFQDHLKSIFLKTGMKSRRELLQQFVGRFRK